MKITSVQLGLGIVTVSLLILIYLIILIKQRVLLINPELQLDFAGKKIQYWNEKPIKRDDYSFGKTKNRKYHVPKFMLDLYESNRVTGCNNSRPDVVRSVVPKHAGPILSNEIPQDISTNHLLIFDLPAHSEDEEFVSAELKILTLVEINANALVGVERLLKVSLYDDASRKLLFHQEMLVRHVNNTWLSFNITEPVIDILKDNSAQKKYLKIVITITKSLEYFQASDNDLKLSLLPISENFEHDYPVLLLSYSSSSSNVTNYDAKTNNSRRVLEVTKREKRGIEEDYEDELSKLWNDEAERKTYLKKLKRLKNACRRKPLYVDFSEIEYDEWIVQPSGYEAYQCQGRCFYPVAEHLDPTKHAIIQALLHNLAPSKVSRSCCVPTRLNSISILYVDENGVLTYRYAYRDMVVLECGCR